MVSVGLIAVALGLIAFVLTEREKSRHRTLVRRMAVNRLSSARKLEQAALAYCQSGGITVDSYYQTSVHLLNAERDVAGTDRIPLASLREHRDRMAALLQFHSNTEGLDTGMRKVNAEYYLAEANYWLERSRSGP